MGPKYSLFLNIQSLALSVTIVFIPVVNTTLAKIFFPISFESPQSIKRDREPALTVFYSNPH